MSSSCVQVSGFEGADELGEALQGCDLVLIPAGVPRKPGLCVCVCVYVCVCMCMYVCVCVYSLIHQV